MISITAEIIKWYRRYEGETIALALRDMTAEVMQLEFEAEHCMRLDPSSEDFLCEICVDDSDPRHAYSWEHWQRAAHERLMGETK